MIFCPISTNSHSSVIVFFLASYFLVVFFIFLPIAPILAFGDNLKVVRDKPILYVIIYIVVALKDRCIKTRQTLSLNLFLNSAIAEDLQIFSTCSMQVVRSKIQKKNYHIIKCFFSWLTHCIHRMINSLATSSFYTTIKR